MQYIEKEDLQLLFNLVYTHFSKIEDVPSYESEERGLQKLDGILEGAKQSYYSTLVEKASYYLIQINKDHFFSNGNKRIALVFVYVFLYINRSSFRDESREFYQNILTNLFPTFKEFEDDPDFTSEGFGLYNLSIIIADSQKHVQNYDELKEKVTAFIEQSIESLTLDN